jgi:hypothetical protein
VKSIVATILLSFAGFNLTSCAEPPAVVQRANVASDNGTKAPVIDPPISDPSDPVVPTTDPVIVDPVVGTDPVIPKPPEPVVIEPVAPTGKPLVLVGGIDPTSYYIKVGQISGWAGDKNGPDGYLEVKFYADGDNKTGTLMGSTKANLVGSDGGVDGDHAFIMEVPQAFKDGKARKIYAYAVSHNTETILNANFPYTLTFYAPKGGAAQAVYNKVGFPNCNGCHNFEYIDRWDVLTRSGDSGWTKDDNYLYNKIASGHRSINGNKKPCEVINCTELKNWFTAEFGN